ncbi:MAG: hypothetical protein ACRCTI_12450, partial [Beijerinckiaceae bacterium]
REDRMGGGEAIGKMVSAAAAGLLAAGLAACGTVDGGTQPGASGLASAPAQSGPLTERPTTLRREQLVGRWGVASFRDEKDRRRVEAQARAQCRLPYNITLGPTDGVMMHVADDSKLLELRLKGASDGKTYLGTESPPGDWQDREVVSLNEREIVLRFVDPDAGNRYGTMVYVRCG